ncbi:phosphoenolpyruvate synthase [Patescibacteria group bacterium]|nr:phosphoenolpyruvate synthase [Patescibacteria group bacterium]
MEKSKKDILWFKEISSKDVALVGGKNASLGEMFSQLQKKGINIPNGFCTTSYSYQYFLKKNKILPRLKEVFKTLNVHNIRSLQKVGKEARSLILKAEFSEDFKKEIIKAYRRLSKEYGEQKGIDVAVRSSATAEDLPKASFAGLHESYLNIKGKEELLEAVKKCIASLFNDRAISYREEKGFDHFKVALSVGVQKMVRSDLASAGVMFTLDTETGFKDIVLINSAWGLGEMIVKGKVIADEFLVFKPTLKKGFAPIISKDLGTKRKKLIYSKKETKITSVSHANRNKFTLSDKEILKLAKWGTIIESHYSKKMKRWMPQDIEWAKDGKLNQLFIVQARPETIHATKEITSFSQYVLKEKGKLILEGEAIGSKIASGKTRVISDASKIRQFKPGEILVTKITDPDWEPIMKIAKAIITDSGSRTSHAAIISRELGIPAVVGTQNATKVLKTGKMITVDCSEGQNGRILSGKLEFEIRKYNLKKIPKTKTEIMMNIGHPDSAFAKSFLPNSGIGLAREEFIIASKIQIHPLALYHFEKLKDKKLKNKISKLTIGYDDKKDYYIDKLSQGIAKIAAAFYPKPVIIRFSDFKTNEYSELIGGELFEPVEANPMLGWRGASRYYDKKFKPAFKMECEAIKKVREKFGLKNLLVMIPFCRTVEEGEKVLKLMKEYGLKSGKDGLKVYMMCEIPSNIILADQFLDIFDGMSIGSNDLTQLVLGLGRDSAIVNEVGDERNPAVKNLIKKVIADCKKRKKYIGICGEAPSTYPEFAEFLVEQGIDSISLNPDTVIATTLIIAKKEKALRRKR